MAFICLNMLLAAVLTSGTGSAPRTGDSPDIHAAVRSGLVDTVDALLSDSPASAQARTSLKQTPLHVAMLAGTNSPADVQRRERIAQALLVAGADVNATDERGMSPLHLAAMKGRETATALLIEAGGDIHARDHLGRAALHYAAMGNHKTLIDRLIGSGAEVNAMDAEGNTPLHLAALRFRSAASARLIAHGADVMAVNAAGRTPLLTAAGAGPDADEVDALVAEVAELLLKSGAAVNAPDAEGTTALRIALNRDRARLAEVLRRFGAVAIGAAAEMRSPSGYPTYTQINATLADAETNYPGICRREYLGNSYLGQEMWALCITDNVTLEEDEPEFRYVSTMHGDEVTGVELCLHLIGHLTGNYGLDPRVTDIVDGVELWIVPCMNPDGYVAGTRNNAQGINLNRDFPDPFTSPDNTPAGRAPETGNIMNWSFARSFTLAANYHGGALVVNYPFDNNPAGASVYTSTPDDDLFIFISEEYSQHNPPMWNSPVFYHGITNGAAWYAISGGLQDWSYRYMGTNEVTIEVSEVKSPPASQIPAFWNENRESMLVYLESCLLGVRGLVTDAATGLPLAAAVRVTGRDHDVFTDPDVGDYHRMLLPGMYEVMFDSPPYDPVTVPGVSVAAGDATRVDVALWRTTLLFPNGGETLPAHTPVTITWDASPLAQFQVQVTANASETTTITDGFETGAIGPEYTPGGHVRWTIATSPTHSGSYTSRSGPIGHSQESWLTRQAGGGALRFWYRVSSEAGYDWFNFYLDGIQQVHASGSTGWLEYSTVLTEGDHELKWEYVKDGTVSSGSDAAWVDDIEITQGAAVWTDVEPLSDTGATSASWTPSEAGSDYKVRVRAYYPDDTWGRWDQSDAPFSVSTASRPGDIDGNGQVDLADFATFAVCFGAPVASPPPSCSMEEAQASDLDGSGQIDLADFATFALHFGT